jgi:hypothetical protein
MAVSNREVDAAHTVLCRHSAWRDYSDALISTPSRNINTTDAHALWQHAVTAGGDRATNLERSRRLWATAASVNSN